MESRENLYDVVIVGAGPAGLSCAIYMARAKYRVLVLEKEKIGGQITITSEIVNYPGVERTSGKELTDNMKIQAESFGAEFAAAEVLDMELEKDIKVLHTTSGVYNALGVVLAVGANPRKLGFKGEKEFQGRGVAYCATCDGEFFSGMEVFVIGGGFAAVEEGIFLTKYARKVNMIVREEDFTCAKTVADQVAAHDKITVKFHTEIKEVKGDGMVSFARFADNQTGEEWTYEAGEDGGFGVFVFAGYVPNTAWIPAAVKKNEQGYIVTDERRKTNLDGVYAAGDVCVKDLRQVVTAVSDGATAATSLEKYVSELHERLDLPEFEVKRAAGAGKSRPQHREEAGVGSESGGFISAEIKGQLGSVFEKFQNRVIVKAWLDDGPVSGEIGGFLEELGGLTEKVSCVRADKQEERNGRLLPSMEICYEDGRSSGIQFHGVPGGHEFNSFIIALYNVAGPGQDVDEDAKARLERLDRDVNIKIMVSLSCTMCPEAVMAAQKAAAVSEHVTAEMIDLQHYPELKSAYRIMSVPCMVIDDKDVHFGKKNFSEVVNMIV
ncbi:FAD-dependent oxidoreductase [Clostridium sp. AM58-1XD]|uniref:FAD-dependent oxidoreductase n=1 Tax=Clostridium sp. AM58-1XD TaxID=2292307 RepID=UPI000E466635|nr:FAD-dependent oxidoreductase [Clostridium sp. AM58-1XD]RGZ01847.1 FAD-dependent oxidoreductase [Clostridium sp. AM58-1XD]